MSTDTPSSLSWLEAETLRYARRTLRAFTPSELAAHLRVTDQHARPCASQFNRTTIIACC